MLRAYVGPVWSIPLVTLARRAAGGLHRLDTRPTGSSVRSVRSARTARDATRRAGSDGGFAGPVRVRYRRTYHDIDAYACDTAVSQRRHQTWSHICKHARGSNLVCMILCSPSIVFFYLYVDFR